MKVLSFVILACLALSVVSQNIPNHPECPVYEEGDLAYIFEHPTDCTKFYICSASQEAVEKDCMPGLEFNPEVKVCDWPNGRCDNLTTDWTPES